VLDVLTVEPSVIWLVPGATASSSGNSALVHLLPSFQSTSAVISSITLYAGEFMPKEKISS
jgi:hypothetical protein